jgi:hypothetical protein
MHELELDMRGFRRNMDLEQQHLSSAYRRIDTAADPLKTQMEIVLFYRLSRLIQ